MPALDRPDPLLAALIGASPLPIIGLDPDLTVRIWNPAAERLFGWTAGEVLGGPYPLVPPDAAGEFAGYLRAVLAGRSFDGIETRRRRRDGSLVDVRISVAPACAPDGTVTRIVVLVADITERRRAEARQRLLADASALLASSLEYEATLGRVARLAIPVFADWAIVDVVEPDRSVRRVAVAAADPAKEAVLETLRARYSPTWESPQPAAQALRTARPAVFPEFPPATLAATARDAEHLALVERLAPASAIAVPLVARGHTVGALTFATAESGRRYAAADVDFARELAQRAALAVDNARLFREATERRREAEVVAELARSITGSLDPGRILRKIAEGAKDLCGSDRALIALPEPGSRVMVFRYGAGGPFEGYETVRIEAGKGAGGEVLRTGRPFRTADYVAERAISADYLPLARRQSVRALLVVPIRSDDQVEGLLYVSNTVPRPFTERDEQVLSRLADHAAIALKNSHLFAREQAARAEAETANRAKDEFLATLSHELRTPLNAILGWAQLLRAHRDPATVERALETIERNAKLQAQLVEDLLDLSRIVAGKVRLDTRPVNVPAVVEAAVDSVRPAAAAKGIELAVGLDPTATPVLGDPDRLQQVLWNLLSNAVKFTPRGGQVQVRLDRTDSQVRIRVTDSGQGIRPEVLPFVFDRFRQGDSTTTRAHGGLGLGLAIVRHLVELHGGLVSAESAGEGHGATFTVRLPLMPIRLPEGEATPLARLEGPRCDGLRVLVVDDEPDSRELVAAFLGACGADVETVGSAAAALAAVKARRPDVLVSDLAMPAADGFELIRAVRALPPERGGRVPAVALTALAGAETRVRALVEGFDGYVAKPVEPLELAAVVVSLAGRARS